jgi:GH25 family lysozyme M1 (1,4-beta-N-acetylmuramidase)
LRASDGTNPDNETTLAQKWTPARSAGLICGAYHLYRPDKDPIVQADLFLRRFNEAVSIVEISYLPAIIDVEILSQTNPPADYAAGIRTWIGRVEADQRFAGRKTIVYTSQSKWQAIGDPPWFGANPLWVADHSKNPPRMPSGWTAWTFFQHSETGRVVGIPDNVDLDYFAGSLDDLTRLAAAPGKAPIA